MQTLRKQTILSSIFMIMGFAFGGLTVFFYTKFGVPNKSQLGLTKIMVDFSQLAIVFSTMGFNSVLYKFFPYFNDNLPPKKNEIITVTLVISLIGFTVFSLLGYLIKPYFISKYVGRSPLVVENYFYLFVFSFGFVLFNVFEVVSYVTHQSIVSNFLKETLLRLLSICLIVLLFFGKLSFNGFITLYSLQTLVLATLLFIHLRRKKLIYFHLAFSKVAKKFWKKMVSMQTLVFSGTVIMALTAVLDSFIIAKLFGEQNVADFGLAQYGANFVGIPQKAILGASIGILAKAWKDKNLDEINRIYRRSCINLSLMALFLFGNVWLNVVPLIDTLHIDPTWKIGMNTLFFICVARTIDASTGVNNIIIGTSTFWRFDFITGFILLAIRIPTAWVLIGKFGIIGSAYSDIISMLVYNFIRYEYLRRKFNMQPFNYKNMLALLLAVTSYFAAFYLCINLTGFIGIITRALVFSGVMIIGIFSLNLTPDARQLWDRWVLKIRH